MPIVRDDATGSTVTDFLSLADPDGITGDNLVAVWYQRGEDGSWSAKSWLTQDPAEAVKAVKLARSIPDTDDELWPDVSPEAIAAISNPESGKSYADGILLEDPLAVAVVGSPVREELVALLTIAGYKSADLPTDKWTDECPRMWMVEHLGWAVASSLNAPEGQYSDKADGVVAFYYHINPDGDMGPFNICSQQPSGPHPDITVYEFPRIRESWGQWTVSCFNATAISPTTGQLVAGTRCCWNRQATRTDRRRTVRRYPDGHLETCLQERTATWRQERCATWSGNGPNPRPTEPTDDANWTGAGDPTWGSWGEWSDCIHQQ